MEKSLSLSDRDLEVVALLNSSWGNEACERGVESEGGYYYLKMKVTTNLSMVAECELFPASDHTSCKKT